MELLVFISVTTNEVGGLLKKGGVLGLGSDRRPFNMKERRSLTMGPSDCYRFIRVTIKATMRQTEKNTAQVSAMT